MKNKKTTLLLLMLMAFPFLIFSQGKNYWHSASQNVNNAQILGTQTRVSKYKTMRLELADFKTDIEKAPLRGKKVKSAVLMTFPFPKGEMKDFKIFKTHTMSPELAAKFPSISSYVGISENKKYKLRLTITKQGAYGMIMGGEGMIFINPMTHSGTVYKVFNQKNATRAMEAMQCRVIGDPNPRPVNQMKPRATDDATLRTYELAVATTGEYSRFHINAAGVSSGTVDEKKAAVLAAIVVTMDRVNGIYERAVALTMVLLPNEEDIIFLNGNTDPFSNNDTYELIDESQAVIDSIIGFDNYDIGHTFSTGGGGLASLRSPCTNRKASGITGTSAPVGDPYAVDYVAHEMGHQFGANHTFNNACGGNQAGNTAVEPGSGVTIMGYAGICAPNIDNHSIPFFHAVSIAEIYANITGGSGSTCGTKTDITNKAPILASIPNYTIPNGTAFVLTADATNVDGDALTYTWDQTDNEIATMPPLPTSTEGPNFRSFEASSSPIRFFPMKDSVLVGNLSPEWQVIPSVARTMNFTLTVRDNGLTAGQTATEDVQITFANSGPFAVTSQNTTTTWNVGGSQTITWDVANTNEAPVNASNVNILLSIDGGQNFDTVLASNVPNDGSEQINIPSVGTTNQARVMVKAVDNIFYAVNSTSISIQESEFVMNFTNAEITVCQPDDAIFNFTYKTFQGFSEATTFSVTNLPNGVNATFSPNTATADGTAVQMSISNTTAANVGSYVITVTGISASVTQTVDVVLNIYDENMAPEVLTAPTNSATEVVLLPTFSWEAFPNAATYEIQVATDNAFSNIIAQKTVEENSFALTNHLLSETTYYWRVRALNDCITGDYSSVFTFTTESCGPCASAGSMKYPTSITLVLFKTINNASTKSAYTDYTAISATIDKGTSYDLIVNVNTGGNYTNETMVWIDWNQDCSFDDPGEEYNLGSATDTDDGPTSNSPLSITVPSDAVLGSTVMRVSTRFNEPSTACQEDFDGEVEDYTLNIGTLGIAESSFDRFAVWPNPNNGTFSIQLLSDSNQNIQVNVFDIRGRKVYDRSFENTGQFNKQIKVQNLESGLYLLNVYDGQKRTVKKLVIK